MLYSELTFFMHRKALAISVLAQVLVHHCLPLTESEYVAEELDGDPPFDSKAEKQICRSRTCLELQLVVHTMCILSFAVASANVHP